MSSTNQRHYNNSNSPSYSLLAESEALLIASDKPNPFLARPLFTATNLARRSDSVASSTAPTRPSPSRNDADEPLTTTIFPKVRVTTFPALAAKAEHRLRADRNELVQQASSIVEQDDAAAGVELDEADAEILKSLHAAAVGLASGQSGVREATKHLMTVCREQQAEIDALARNQSETHAVTSEVKVTCHGVEERCRTTALRVEECAAQVNSMQLEVSNALGDARQMLQRVLQRVIKTTLLANMEASDRLKGTTERRLTLAFLRPWMRRGVARVTAGVLLRRTQRGVQSQVWDMWSRCFLARRHLLRSKYQTLSLSVHRQLLARYMEIWATVRRRRAIAKTASESLLSATISGTRLVCLHKWRRFLRLRQEREVLYNQLASLLYASQRAHARWRSNVWLRWLHHRKVKRRNVQLSGLLANSTVSALRRYSFRRWQQTALQRSTQSHLSLKLAASNRKLATLRLFRQWEEFRRQRWIDRRIQARVARLEANLDLALVSVARSGEMVSTLLERQIELEAQLLQLGASKVSIRQLRPEAFRGSLIDLDHAEAAPSKVVQQIADGGRHRSRSPKQQEEDQQQQVKRADIAASLVPDAGSLSSLKEPESARQRTSGDSAGAPRGAAGIVGEGQAASQHHADPLISLAQHYGVATPSVKRRQLPS